MHRSDQTNPGSTVVLHVGANDVLGGAARAAWRLHKGLERLGLESWVVAGRSSSSEPRTTTLLEETKVGISGWRASAERLAPRLGQFVGDVRLPLASARRFARTELFARADVIHLHNLHGNFFDFGVLAEWGRRKPLVWTLHDMWPLTGHSAYSYECERWRHGCGSCPLFRPDARSLDDVPQPAIDTTARAWRAKRATYAQVEMSVVTPSRWLTDIARDSILMANPESHARQIPYGIDTAVYRPLDRALARDVLRIPEQAEVVLFSAASLAQPRKGLRYLLAALEALAPTRPQLLGISMGSQVGASANSLNIRALGETQDEHLQALAYSAADVVVVPSLADNQPLVMLEAMACGVPVIGSRVGGIPEVLQHEGSGLTVAPGDSDALVEALQRLLDDLELRRSIGEAARRTIVRNHDLDRRAGDYAGLYEQARAAGST